MNPLPEPITDKEIQAASPKTDRVYLNSKLKAYKDFYGGGSNCIQCFVNWMSHREGLETCVAVTDF